MTKQQGVSALENATSIIGCIETATYDIFQTFVDINIMRSWKLAIQIHKMTGKQVNKLSET